jgi:transglutaminase-like putative cysteine protease
VPDVQRVAAPGESRLRLEYAIGLRYDVYVPTAFVLNVHAAETAQQRVLEEDVEVDPSRTWRVDTEPASGNRLLRLTSEPGKLDVRYRAVVEVTQHLALPENVVAEPIDELPAPVLPYLLASRYCQADQVQGLAWREFGDMSPGFAQAAAVSRYVHDHVEFRPGTSTVSTSALETLEQGVGVCRDFVHVTIAMLRALTYPARFVTGVDYGAPQDLGPPDVHSYVEAYIGDRWWLFDPTGITPLTGLIRIGTGRDAADVAFATMFGRVQGTMPQVRFHALEDEADGIAKPVPTAFAVSTAQ